MHMHMHIPSASAAASFRGLDLICKLGAGKFDRYDIADLGARDARRLSDFHLIMSTCKNIYLSGIESAILHKARFCDRFYF